MSNNLESKELPRYKCFKIVSALKIKAILNPGPDYPNQEDSGERILTFSDEGYEVCTFLVDSKYMSKHKPYIGGYYVKYEDGYLSFSPAEAFESGYSRID